MYPLTEINARGMDAPAFPITKAEPLMIEELGADQEAEVIAFLGERPGHTFGMTGFIRSNGLVSSHNLGSFYACRDKAGQLQGVALIGRYILFETRSDAAIEAFAHLAQDCRNAHMLLGEQGEVETFWRYYADGGQSPRLYGREYLFEQRWPVELKQEVAGLRLATMDELDLIVPAHAQIAYDESGIDPLLADPEGFRKRCARRIEKGQSWVLVENGRLVFKAEVVTDTPETVYLEGIWVDPLERGKGIGSRCMSQLSRSFLMRSSSVCVLVNEKFKSAQAFYKKAGFKFISHYDTIFLKQQVH
jgi:predicted GNAT family acetyltransferase